MRELKCAILVDFDDVAVEDAAISLACRDGTGLQSSVDRGDVDSRAPFRIAR
jgi:hypothetical protein